jgi:hypothetical protein
MSSVPVSIDEFSTLAARVSNLERQIASFSTQLEVGIASQEKGLETIRSTVANLKNEFESLKSAPVIVTPPTLPVQQPPRQFAVKYPGCADGIISYLTKKHGGNVDQNGIVTLASKSGFNDPQMALTNLASLTVDACFVSDSAPGQWVCWDFREMRVHLTSYTIGTTDLQSWVLEGSIDGVSWTEIDRQADCQAFRDNYSSISFPVVAAADFRFIRLTQGATNYRNDQALCLFFVEFFGTLSE